MKKIREGNYYRFHYNDEYREKLFSPNHCFDGLLIVEKVNGSFIFYDTYWSSDRTRFTMQEIKKKGRIEFLCNKDEIEKIGENDTRYYNDSDIISLKSHHGYQGFYAVKKGTPRSKSKMLMELNHKRDECLRKIEWNKSEIERCNEKIKIVKNNDLDIYI